MLLLDRDDVAAVLATNPDLVRDSVFNGYASLSGAGSVNPASGFLRWADRPEARIISLPAYFDDGDRGSVAGVKWVASFPGNLAAGLPRAHAMIVLSDSDTGVPLALVDATEISLRRTAASAVLAVTRLGFDTTGLELGIVGAGPLAEVFLSELRIAGRSARRVLLADRDPARATGFADRARVGWADVVTRTPDDTVAKADVLLFTTSAGAPWVAETDLDQGRRLVLHLSLRDIPPRFLVGANNITDQTAHALRERTSLGMAVELGLDPAEIRQLPDLLVRPLPVDDRPVVFSPFGLGVLDMAVAKAVYETARETGTGTRWGR